MFHLVKGGDLCGGQNEHIIALAGIPSQGRDLACAMIIVYLAGQFGSIVPQKRPQDDDDDEFNKS